MSNLYATFYVDELRDKLKSKDAEIAELTAKLNAANVQIEAQQRLLVELAKKPDLEILSPVERFRKNVARMSEDAALPEERKA